MTFNIKPPNPEELSTGTPRPEGTGIHVRNAWGGARLKDPTLKLSSPEERQQIADMRARVATQLGLRNVPKSWEPYIQEGWEFCRLQLRQLADRVGGGDVGPGPGSLIQSAALQLVVSRYVFSEGMNENDIVKLKLASQLANDSRANVLAAHELCVRESKGRKEDWKPLSDDELAAGGTAEKAARPKNIPGWDEKQRRMKITAERKAREAEEQRKRYVDAIPGDPPGPVDDGV